MGSDLIEKVVTNETNIANLKDLRKEDSTRLKHIEIIVKVEFVTILASLIIILIQVF